MFHGSPGKGGLIPNCRGLLQFEEVLLHFEEVCSNLRRFCSILKRCAPGAVTAATEGGTGGREGMGASKNEETCQEQLLCICSFAFVFAFHDFVVFIYVSFYICTFVYFQFVLSARKKEKDRTGGRSPHCPDPRPTLPRRRPVA